jgi:hypothetical protein
MQVMLPSMYKGEMRDMLQRLHVDDADGVVAALEAYFFKNYDIITFGLY